MRGSEPCKPQPPSTFIFYDELLASLFRALLRDGEDEKERKTPTVGFLAGECRFLGRAKEKRGKTWDKNGKTIMK